MRGHVKPSVTWLCSLQSREAQAFYATRAALLIDSLYTLSCMWCLRSSPLSGSLEICLAGNNHHVKASLTWLRNVSLTHLSHSKCEGVSRNDALFAYPKISFHSHFLNTFLYLPHLSFRGMPRSKSKPKVIELLWTETLLIDAVSGAFSNLPSCQYTSLNLFPIGEYTRSKTCLITL